ncbi:family 43 glycosylhydrolase [Amnibacterium kyonggiense]|uniref:Glycosyl hydrolase family 43 n=1 Tax=Amnibacterium kyonggiense TaxID=595671 RepID=A0A4R7FRJ8_9MICO|nr:family 43 glycosylhydrolase [Amnibacterium kyonggiense]TDS80348.1 glycosyl hydrolase family 43 [Amnibacterium kyonggiense]
MTELLPRPIPDEFASPSPVPDLLADPSLLVWEGRYYLYPTSDGSPEWDATSFSVWSSDDLVSWTAGGEVLRLQEDVGWAARHAWAPAALQRDGRFYLYFTAESNIGVAVADSPFGPFNDLGRPLVAHGDFAGRAIDPAVFVDGDRVFLYWGNGVAHGVQLYDDLMSFDPGAVVDFVPTDFREAAWVHRRGDVYYLSWSVDDTRSEDYHVRYATGPTPLGPWVDRGVLLQKRPEIGVFATGHHAVLQLPDSDEWVIAYHRWAIPSGDGYRREIVFDRLVHLPGGLLQPVLPARDSLSLPLTHHHRKASNVAS